MKYSQHSDLIVHITINLFNENLVVMTADDCQFLFHLLVSELVSYRVR